MRVFLVTYNVLHLVANGKLSGAEKVVSDICTNLDKNKYKPIGVCTGGSLKGYYEKKGIQTEVADISSLNPREILKLRKIIKHNEVKLVHAHDVKASIASALAVYGLKIPVISHLHTNYDWLKKQGTLKAMDGFFRRKYALSIACSEKVADFYKKYNKSFDTSKMISMGNKFNFKEFDGIQIENKNSFKQQLGIDKEEFIFGYVGRLEDEKGVALLVDSFYVFNKKHSDAMLVLVGDGRERQRVEAQIREYGMENKVRLMGHQSNVYNYINIYDAFVLPSKREGLPIAILETMAMGKVIISTPTDGGIPEVIKNYETGIIMKERKVECMVEAMEYVYLNRKVAEDMGKKGREFLVDNFNIIGYVKELEDVYGELIHC